MEVGQSEVRTTKKGRTTTRVCIGKIDKKFIQPGFLYYVLPKTCEVMRVPLRNYKQKTVATPVSAEASA